MPDLDVQQTGRLVTLHVQPGEQLVGAILAAAGDLAVRRATIRFQGELASGRLVLGQRKYTRATNDPDRVSFGDARTVVGTGEFGDSGASQPELRLYGSIGREREVFVAEILEATAGRNVTVVMLEGRG